MKTYSWICFGISLLALMIAGCSGKDSMERSYQETRFLMDTVIEINAYGINAESAVQAAFTDFQRIQALSDHFNPDSQVAEINHMAGIRPVVVDPELFTIIEKAVQLSEKTDGAFDITVGPLTELWRIGYKDQGIVPTQAEIEQALPLVGYQKVLLDTANHSIFLTQAGMKLDLGGIAKGYAINKAIETLSGHGITSALINAGGDVRIIGAKPDGTPWRVGIQHPRDPEAMVAKVMLKEWDTMETSGDYQRFFIKDGVRYTHILNPKTGRQPTELASATIVYRDQEAQLITSSAFMVLGVEKGLQILANFPGAEAVFVTIDGRVVASPGMAAMLTQTALSQ